MSTSLEAVGVIVAIGEPQTFGTFTKRVLVLEIADGNYPQMVPFEFGGKNLLLLDGNDVKVGATAKVTFNLRGRGWTDPKTGEVKYFGSLSGWKLEVSKETERADEKDSEPDLDIPF